MHSPVESSASAEHAPPPPSGSVWRDIRDALRGTTHDYTSGPLGRAIFLLAVPMVIEMAMESIFAVVDVFFVGRIGAAAVATVGLTESLMIVIYTLAFGLSIGATATVSRRIGEKDADGAGRAAMQVILLGLLISGVLGLIGAIFAPQLLALMGADAEVIATGTGYARVMLGGSATAFLLFVVNAVFRGAGDPAIAMRILIVANSINIVLDPVLIFGLGPFPELGVTGAAIATTIGRGIGLLMAFGMLARGAGHLAIKRSHLTVEPKTMLSIARLSGLGTFQVAIGSMSWMGLVRVVAGFGPEAMAGYTIAIRLVIFAMMPAFGLGGAAATMVGQSLGAKKPERAEAAVWAATKYDVAFLGGIGVIFLLFAPPIVSLFTKDAGVAEVAVTGLRWMSLGFPFFAAGMVLEQSFNGAGDTWTPTWINLWVYWVLQIPLAWFLSYPMGLQQNGVFIAVTVAYSVLAVVSGLLFKRGKWKLKHV
ncbi:MAG: MATE family efflux transporter [Gemmatimonadaceae bacterium]|nr:MATE family efflux transporter [Gemmatimonadaceae bacterium]